MVCSVSTTDSSGHSDFETLQDDHADCMEAAVVALLEALGEDTSREGLRETPRVRKHFFCPLWFLALLSGQA